MGSNREKPVGFEQGVRQLGIFAPTTVLCCDDRVVAGLTSGVRLGSVWLQVESRSNG